MTKAAEVFDFNCRIVYYTPGGARRTAHLKTRAPSAELALKVAKRLLLTDKRREVVKLTAWEAIQQ